MSTNYELVSREVDAALERQASRDVGFDTRLGLIVAFDGAILVGAFAVHSEAEPFLSLFIASFILVSLAMALAVIGLRPATLNFPPDPHLFALPYVLGDPGFGADQQLRSIIHRKLYALVGNDKVLARKLALIQASTTFSVGGAIAFIGEALASLKVG